MFNIGPAELVVIFLVALLVVGPKRLPEVGRSIGKALREFRRTTEEVRSTFEASLDDDDEPSRNGKAPISRLSAEPDDPDEMQVHDIPGQKRPDDPAAPADQG